MTRLGINYDTGFLPGGESSRPSFEPDDVRAEITMIAEELGCKAIRISGADPARIALAARAAVDAGLAVWFAPFPCELTTDEMLPLVAECADRAEELRVA